MQTRLFFNIILYILLGYLAVWITLFLHEFSHAFFGWLFGVCKSPISIGYLPVVKLPMTPLIDDIKIKKLNMHKQILIHGGELLDFDTSIHNAGLLIEYLLFLLGPC